MRGFFATGCVIVSLVGCSGGTNEAPPVLSVSTPPQAAPSRSDTSGVGRNVTTLLEEGKLEEALAAATKSVTQQPNNPVCYEARAAVHHRMGKLHDAVADFTQALELEPNNARLFNNRGFLYLSLAQYDQALADFDASIACSPTHANAFSNRGLLHIAKGRYRQAILDLDQALQANPTYVDAYNNRGFAYMQLGRWDRALADFNRALQLDPKYVNAVANRGLVKQNLGDRAGAILDFTEAMLLDQDNPKYYAHRRDVYLLEGAADKAQQDAAKIEFLQQLKTYTAAIAANPGDPQAYLERASHFRAQGNESRAWDDLCKAVELAPAHTEARLRRATLAFSLKKYEAAVADCDAVLERGPHQQALSIRGDCRLALKDVDGALADLEAAMRLDDAVAEAYFLKAGEYARQGDAASAEEYYAKAEALAPHLKNRVR